MTRRRRHFARTRPETGATLVEFALVAPVVFVLIFGLIGGCYLAYQDSALHDGATAGARMASIETSLTGGPAGPTCESNQPISIEKAVAQASPLLAVNPNPLCVNGSDPDVLTQSPPVAGDVNITVTCVGGCTSPSATQVSLSYSTRGLVAPFGLTYNMSATSTDPTPVFSS